MSPPEPKKPLDISNLMSPPELPPLDHFHQGFVAAEPVPPVMAAAKPAMPRALLSPPVSPCTKGAVSFIDAGASGPGADMILYPNADPSSSPPRPLFSSDERIDEARRAVDKHLATRSAALFFRNATPPRREHYELALHFQSEVMKKYTANPRGWLRKERELLLADRRAGSRRNKQLRPVLAPKPAVSRSAAGRVAKPEKTKRPVRLAPQRLAPSATDTPRQQATATATTAAAATISVRAPGATPEPRTRTVAPNREDKDFLDRPDYCPPSDDLPVKPNSLKVDWKGNPLDLSSDPFRHLLHPDELLLAAGLRLDCATYLTSKRRIFERRLECAKIGKEFRKTDAQQACKIDVNKASKLWTAYEKVGWLDLRHMRKFIGAPN